MTWDHPGGARWLSAEQAHGFVDDRSRGYLMAASAWPRVRCSWPARPRYGLRGRRISCSRESPTMPLWSRVRAGSSTSVHVPLARRVLAWSSTEAKLIDCRGRGVLGWPRRGPAVRALHLRPDHGGGSAELADVALSLTEVARVMSFAACSCPTGFPVLPNSRRPPSDGLVRSVPSAIPVAVRLLSDLRALDVHTYDLELVDYEEVEIGIPMSSCRVVDDILGHVGIEEEIAGGQQESHIRASVKTGSALSSRPALAEVLFVRA